MISASAPGKIVLCGEYAVLDGAPAVSLAIDRRARASVRNSDNDWHSVTAPGFTPVEGRFVTRDGHIDWLEGAEPFALVDAVMRRRMPECSVAIELDTNAFVDSVTGEKLGLGSSAALAVALLAALRKSGDVFDDALAAHRVFQGGTGSGVDVATAVHGGLIEYRGNAVTRLSWPGGLALRVIWTGVPASTPERLQRLEVAARQPSRRRLGQAAERMAGAWTTADTVLDEFPAYIDTLRAFSVDHDLGIFDAGHDELADLAAADGLVYKPCGAGGGDVGVLLGPSEQALDDFTGGRALRCGPDPAGILLEQH